jgi:anti-sigma factor RsiW
MTMTCEELLEALLDYVGGELVVERRTTIETHISGCKNCSVLVESYTHTVRLTRALPKCGSLPPGVEARLRAVIEPELKAGGAQAKPPGAAG